MKFILLALVFLLSSPAFAQYQRLTINSELLGEGVTVQISLPETYHHSDNFLYPVLVVLDGSTQFNHSAASVNFYSTYAVIPEMIVVGVSLKNRLMFFSHTEPDAFAGRAGKADKLTRFLQDELLNLLNAQYRVAPYYIIAGHSLSGLYTSHLAVTGRSKFNAAISISPSLWWDEAVIVSDYKRNHSTNMAKPFRWFLSMASEPNEMPEAFESMLLALKHNSKSGLYHTYERFPDETHDSTPLIGLAKGLQAVFSSWNAIPGIDVMPMSALTKFYEDKTKEFGYKFPLSVHQFNVYGLKAAYEDKPAWGVEILAKGTEAFPHSEILWDSLATAYSLNKNLPAALIASERALELAIANNSIFIGEIKAQNSDLKAKKMKIDKN
jgi:predicted alpha/beta superfamily hydrolase